MENVFFSHFLRHLEKYHILIFLCIDFSSQTLYIKVISLLLKVFIKEYVWVAFCLGYPVFTLFLPFIFGCFDLRTSTQLTFFFIMAENSQYQSNFRSNMNQISRKITNIYMDKHFFYWLWDPIQQFYQNLPVLYTFYLWPHRMMLSTASMELILVMQFIGECNVKHTLTLPMK